MADGDDERTNAVGLFNTARSYRRSAEHLNAARLEVTHPEAPVTFLLCHAIELYLKAHLRGAGRTVSQLKQIGHRVTQLAETAGKSGLPIGPEHSEVLSHIDDFDVALGARYIVTGFKNMPTNEALTKVAAVLDQTVGSELVKAGLPIRVEEFKTAEQMVFVEDLTLAAGLTPQTLNPVLLIGIITHNEQSLRIILEHSRYVSGVNWSGWPKWCQLQLADLKDVFAGQQVRLPIVTCTPSPSNEPEILKWGAIDGLPVNDIQKGKKYRARIRFIGTDGREQKPFHFLLIRTSSNEYPYLVNVTTESDFGFMREWP